MTIEGRPSARHDAIGRPRSASEKGLQASHVAGLLELPEVGRQVKKGDGAAVVESVKAASDVYSPISGEVVETNADLVDNPGTVNEAPEGGGWFMKIKVADKGEVDGLLDQAGYQEFLKTL